MLGPPHSPTSDGQCWRETRAGDGDLSVVHYASCDGHVAPKVRGGIRKEDGDGKQRFSRSRDWGKREIRQSNDAFPALKSAPILSRVN